MTAVGKSQSVLVFKAHQTVHEYSIYNIFPRTIDNSIETWKVMVDIANRRSGLEYADPGP